MTRRTPLLTSLLLTSLLLTSTALAQSQSPVTFSVTHPSPQTVQAQDEAGKWVPLGTLDAAKHTWAGRGAALMVDQFGAKGDFVNDDGLAIQAALQAARPGATTVWLSPHPYWNKTQALVVPPGVKLSCMGTLIKNSPTSDYTAMPCTIYQTIAATGPLVYYGEVSNVGVLNDIVHFLPQTTRAQMQAYVAAFAGVGLQAGLADTGSSGSQSILQNVMVGGFATCNRINGAYQAQMRQALGDCANGLDIAGSFDNNFLSDVEYWEFLTTHKTFGTAAWNVSALADNGSGSWRLTIASSADPPQTGEKLWYYPGLGTLTAYPGGSGAQGLWTVTAVDATHVDLQGSVTAPATTGTTVSGRGYIAVASTADLAPGMNVSGAGIPAGAKIAAVWRTRPAISLDQGHLATASASGVALSFTNDPYSGSGGQLRYEVNFRSGTGFAVGHADGTSCSGCFAFGYGVGFNFRGGSFNSFTNANVDGLVQTLANKNFVQIGVEFTGDANASYFQTAALTSAGVHILNNVGTTGAGGGNEVVVRYPPESTMASTYLENAAGGLTLRGLSVSYGGAFLLDNLATPTPMLFGVNTPNAMIYSNGGAPNFIGAGNSFGGLIDQRAPLSHSAHEFFAANTGGANYNYYDPSGALDSKWWRTRGAAAIWCLSTVNDAQDTAVNVFCAGRSGLSLTNFVLAGDTNVGGVLAATSFKVGATPGFSGTKTAGSCVLTISGGIVTNVTGC